MCSRVTPILLSHIAASLFNTQTLRRITRRIVAGTRFQLPGTLEAEEAVEYLGRSGNWIKIAFHNRTAFVYGKYLSE